MTVVTGQHAADIEPQRGKPGGMYEKRADHQKYGNDAMLAEGVA
ncbi:MAG TPA: hypothetical protein VGA51_02505 [Casimicrobiaceae bacterium]